MTKNKSSASKKVKEEGEPAAARWTEDETHNLINIWSDADIQKCFKSTRRHKLIYQTIAKEHDENGYSRTWKQIRSKLRNLKSEYGKRIPHSGEEPPKWPFWMGMHIILGQKECHSDENLLDTIDIEENGSEYSDEDDIHDRETLDEIPKKEKAKKNFEKIFRPPRQTLEDKKKEEKFRQELLDSNKRNEERLDRSEAREIATDKRDQQVCNAFINFTELFGQYLKHKLVASGVSVQTNENVRSDDLDSSAEPQNNAAKNEDTMTPIVQETAGSSTANSNEYDGDVFHMGENNSNSEEVPKTDDRKRKSSEAKLLGLDHLLDPKKKQTSEKDEQRFRSTDIEEQENSSVILSPKKGAGTVLPPKYPRLQSVLKENRSLGNTSGKKITLVQHENGLQISSSNPPLKLKPVSAERLRDLVEKLSQKEKYTSKKYTTSANVESSSDNDSDE